MSEYIKRSDAISAAIEAADKWDGWYMTSRDDLIERYLNDIPTADVRGEWISVKDRLPDPYTQVCVVWVNHRPASYYMYIKDVPFVSTAVWYEGTWYWWNE